MAWLTDRNNTTGLKRFFLDFLRGSFSKVGGFSYLFSLLLSAIAILLVVLISQGLASDGGTSSPEAMGGTVALSTVANQAIEAVKKKMKGEDIIPPQNSEAIKVLEYKIQQQEKQVIQLWRKLRHIESFLTRATKSFNPKETKHD